MKLDSKDPSSIAFISEIRSVVYRYEERNGMFIGTNLNGEIGLEPHSDYTLAEYLLDQVEYEHRKVTAVEGDIYLFSDRTEEILQEREEGIDLRVLAELFALEGTRAVKIQKQKRVN